LPLTPLLDHVLKVVEKNTGYNTEELARIDGGIQQYVMELRLQAVANMGLIKKSSHGCWFPDGDR